MKSLKPNDLKTIVLTQNGIDELNGKIQQLEQSQQNLSSEIESIQNTLDSETVGRGNPTFDSITTGSLNSSTSNLGEATADSITADEATITSLESQNSNITNTLTAVHINTPDLDAEKAKIDELESDSIKTTDIDTDTIEGDSANFNTSNITNLTVVNLNASNYNVNKVITTSVETPLVEAENVTADEATITSLDSTNSEIENLEATVIKNRNRYFEDENNRLQIVGVNENQPGYICIDTKGVQTAKIVAKDSNGELFTVIYSNPRETPLVQWSKRNETCLNKLFFGFKSKKLYLQIWNDCSIQWQLDGFEDLERSPTTYTETLPEPLEDCYRYNVGRKYGMVLMGDGTGSTVLSVQGTIEGNFLLDADEFIYLNIYTDSLYDLFKYAKSLLRSGSDEDGWTYEKAQVWGYLQHKVEAEHYEYTEHVTVLNYLKNRGNPLVTVVSPDVPEYLESIGFTPTQYSISNIEFVVIFSMPDGYYVKDDITGEYKAVKYVWSVEMLDSNTTGDLILLDPEKNILQTASNETVFPKVKYYTRELVSGSTSPYMDEDGTEIEALEKVEYVDENTIVLTIDNKHGQDTITIDGTDATTDEVLPFVLGFTIRTPKIDATFNSEALPIKGTAAQQYFYGD